MISGALKPPEVGDVEKDLNEVPVAAPRAGVLVSDRLEHVAGQASHCEPSPEAARPLALRHFGTPPERAGEPGPYATHSSRRCRQYVSAELRADAASGCSRPGDAAWVRGMVRELLRNC